MRLKRTMSVLFFLYYFHVDVYHSIRSNKKSK